MIIDSHTHYNNNAYKKPFWYLTYGEDGYALRVGERDQLFQELLDADIPCLIEPGASLQSCGKVLELAAQYPGRIFPAIGIHPTRSILEKWSDRRKLDAYANKPGLSLGIPKALFEDYYRDTCALGKADMIAFLKANSLYTIKPSLYSGGKIMEC